MDRESMPESSASSFCDQAFFRRRFLICSPNAFCTRWCSCSFCWLIDEVSYSSKVFLVDIQKGVYRFLIYILEPPELPSDSYPKPLPFTYRRRCLLPKRRLFSKTPFAGDDIEVHGP